MKSQRLMDLVLLLLGFPVWGTLLLFTFITVRVGMGRPVFFRQERAGRHGKPFRLLKFRTMTDACDADGRLLPDAERLPPLGRFLRSTSLDELPEIWNILKGDMSLVGPRPLPTIYVERYSDQQRRRLDVRPGLTGWAQINGRNELGWEDRFAHDLWYVERRSLWLDLKIVFLTVYAVISRRGISAEGEATMTEFMGPERPSDQSEAHPPV